MKIALAVEHFDPGHGGAEQYAWGFARWLAREGHEVHVFAARAADAREFTRSVTVLDASGAPSSERPLALAASLARALTGKQFDVVHAFNHLWPCDVLRLGGGVHLAFEEWNARSGGSWPARALKRASQGMLPRYRALRENERRQFDDSKRLFIAVSRRVAADMESFYPSCAGRIRLIHNGVDLQRFRPADRDARAEAREKAGIPGGAVALLFVSNNFRLKGLRDLVEALPRAAAMTGRDLRLVVAGRGRIGPYLRLASRRGVASKIVVAAPGGDMENLYAAADVLVHPSYYDSFGFVGLEALACGLPIVISRNSGVSELMTEGRGAVMVDMPCGRERLAAAIAQACADEFRAEARAHNRRIAEQHPIEGNYRKVMDVYGEVEG